jgi:ABC-type amino acid transport substrate-binding protein
MNKGLFFATCMTALIVGCTTQTKVKPAPTRLRVGITPNARPLIFKQNGKIQGIEADFAHKLGEAMGKEVAFIELDWDKQLDALEQNKTDIIMSGMTITPPRSMRIRFTAPYMQSGQTALFNRKNQVPGGLAGNMMKTATATIGCIKGTTGEFFTRQQYPNATIRTFTDPVKAVNELSKERLDAFIHDAPIVWWLSALHERETIAFPEILNVEPLAWAVRQSDDQLLEAVNAQLEIWNNDGTTAKILSTWIPLNSAKQ